MSAEPYTPEEVAVLRAGGTLGALLETQEEQDARWLATLDAANARRAELEYDLAAQKSLVGNLDGELREALARIAELERDFAALRARYGALEERSIGVRDAALEEAAKVVEETCENDEDTAAYRALDENAHPPCCHARPAAAAIRALRSQQEES